MRINKINVTTGIVATALIIGFSSCAPKDRNSGNGQSIELQTKMDTMSYIFGMSLGSNLKQNKIDSVNVDAIRAGVEDGLQGEEATKLSMEEGNQIIMQYMQNKQQEDAQNALKNAESFLEENKSKEGIQTTESGLQYKVIEQGDGPTPTAEDKVRVHYEGKLLDGEVFDSSYERGEPAEFGVTRVIPGWTEVLQLMPVGSTYEVYIHPDLAYGERGSRGAIGPNEALIFKVELLDIIEE